MMKEVVGPIFDPPLRPEFSELEMRKKIITAAVDVVIFLVVHEQKSRGTSNREDHPHWSLQSLSCDRLSSSCQLAAGSATLLGKVPSNHHAQSTRDRHHLPSQSQGIEHIRESKRDILFSGRFVLII